jgi:hypothetical protein
MKEAVERQNAQFRLVRMPRCSCLPCRDAGGNNDVAKKR